MNIVSRLWTGWTLRKVYSVGGRCYVGDTRIKVQSDLPGTSMSQSFPEWFVGNMVIFVIVTVLAAITKPLGANILFLLMALLTWMIWNINVIIVSVTRSYTWDTVRTYQQLDMDLPCTTKGIRAMYAEEPAKLAKLMIIELGNRISREDDTIELENALSIIGDVVDLDNKQPIRDVIVDYAKLVNLTKELELATPGDG